jgi:hypothetical protein
MRLFRNFVLLIGMTLIASPAGAVSLKKCRKLCKPLVADCVATTGKSRRKCMKAFVPPCRKKGLQVCTVTSTTTPEGPTATTTTLPAGGGGEGGVMSLSVDQIEREGASDPRLYTLTITIEYAVVTAGAPTQVALAAASFSVLDQDTEVVYPAAPAAGPGDCSAALVLTKSGPPVTCTLRFHLPRAVGDLSSVDGGQHAELQFESLGLHGSDMWSK